MISARPAPIPSERSTSEIARKGGGSRHSQRSDAEIGTRLLAQLIDRTLLIVVQPNHLLEQKLGARDRCLWLAHPARRSFATPFAEASVLAPTR